MKRIITLLAILFCLNLSTSSQIIVGPGLPTSQVESLKTTGTYSTSGSQYKNNMTLVWNIEIPTTNYLKINYTINTEKNYDYVDIYSISDTREEYHHGTFSGLSEVGELISQYPNGKMRIIFNTNQTNNASTHPLYTGVEVTISQIINFQPNAYFSGTVGIGIEKPVDPTDLLEVYGYNPSVSIRNTNKTQLQIGVPNQATDFAPYSKPGDVVFRALGGVNGHHGLVFNIPNNDMDGKSYVKFGDDGNGGWFTIYNNKTATIDGAVTVRSLTTTGNVGIGVSNPENKLDVNGTIRATEVKVEAGWADFVFEEDYELLPLSEVKNHIQTKKHLPGVPTEAEVKANGVSLGEMQTLFLQKIEELTLYIIEQQETIDTLKTQVAELENILK